MSESTSNNPLDIIGRLALMTAVAVSFITAYSGFVARYAEGGADPTIAALSKVLGGAEEFRPIFDDHGDIIYYEAYNDEGALLGFGLVQTGRGMWGDISLAAGLDLQFRLTGVTIIEQGETPGLGARIEETKFLKQFIEREAKDVKLEKYGGKIDAITGATISSKSVTDILRKEIERMIILKEEGHVNSSTRI